MITVFHAIQSLAPGAEFSVGWYDQTITWHRPETAPVTMEQILAEQRRLQQAYDWAQYQRNRAREYPSVQEQLDALYHAGVFPPEMSARIQAVKTKYPRQFPDHAPTEADATSKMSVEEWLAQEAKTTVVPASSAMSVEEWLAKETKMTAEQWLAQQQSTTYMTREQWLASQREILTPAVPEIANKTPPTMSAEQWLRQQSVQENLQIAQEQLPHMTREEWLAQQANAGN
jgi:hypothetical protein